ncbi:MAG: glycoside hydrolase family 57 protein [Candidatus Omnitrophota bacterium]
MIYLALIFHMHQPYYKNLLTQETPVPWVRLHGTKDYLDMVRILDNYPGIRQTFNLVPSLLEQLEDYVAGTIKDKFLELSYKPAKDLTTEDKSFILERFFSIHKETVIAFHPRYYELFFKKQNKKEFSTQDYLDLQVWFNLSWIDPSFRDERPQLKRLVDKARFFTEEEKLSCLEAQKEILGQIIPAYKQAKERGQIEITVNPYYHPILPLLYSTNTAREANPKSVLPKTAFSYPEDAQSQIDSAVEFYKERFGTLPEGMWPSEEAVSEHILPFIINAGIQWIVTDEGVLFKSLKKKKRDTKLLYQPHLLRREGGNLHVVFRDRNLSDLIGFVYYNLKAEDAVSNFIGHFENINKAFKGQDVLVTLAMDGENAWEYYYNDGHNFLELLYKRLCESEIIKTVTVSDYIKRKPATRALKHLAAGSWIYSEFSKWINNTYKNKAWEYLSKARLELKLNADKLDERAKQLAYKQIYICEGSDWFWWYGDREKDFDYLFRMHLSNFYTIIGKPTPEYLKTPLEP